jgi:amino acid adenylation domain-containing protein
MIQQEQWLLFDFEQGPLVRASLITLSVHQHVLLIGLPALCADRGTLKNLVQELGLAYSANATSPTPLNSGSLNDADESEVVQYLQFSEWQHELLEDPEAEAGHAYWQQQDFSAIATTTLPFATHLGNPAEFEPGAVTVKLDSEISAKIAKIAQQQQTSVDIILLSCWQVLLWRLTGSDVMIGTGCDGRKYEELQGAMGPCSKCLPIGSHLTPDLRFSEVLQQVGQATQEAAEWQEYFNWEPSDLAEQQSCPVNFEFTASVAYTAADVSFSLERLLAWSDRFQIKLACSLQDQGLSITFAYNANCFTTDAIQQFAEQFQVLLDNALEHPDTAISQLEILSDRDRHQLLVEFNSTQTDFPQDKCIHQLFEEQAAGTPEAIAVVFEEQHLTYAELNARANQLAHHLQGLGVEPEVRVGLCVERSVEMIIGVLGILKAGGAYLPLDPALPSQGLANRLQDAQPTVLLTQQRLIDHLPEHSAQIICLDTDWKKIAQERIQNPTSQVTVENLIYILFTSGSTGRPKAVAVEHRQLLNYLYGILERLDVSAGASFALISTIAADLGNTMIFPCLTTGGCLHVLSQACASDPEVLADYGDRYSIDYLKIVPSHLQALLTCSRPEAFLPRQKLILGGEAASWELIEQICSYAPDCQILNHYGPTETTVGVSTYPVESKLAPEETVVPLGRPLANTQIYLLDQHLQPVPVGIPGEIYVGGAGVARGYLNQPELTAERFITHPFSQAFSQEPEARLYQTGDLARYRPDGTIEFLGRTDNQVKIRGYRIELGEIEAVLSQHPSVRSTVVLAREDEPGQLRLIAYVVPRQGQSPTTSDLHRFLQEQLPEYLIPSAFVLLKALPLTANGKVDRQALPEPDLSRPELAETFVAPRTPTEEILAGIWTDVLGLERIGIHDNFFELGGHSLLATQVMSRSRQAFGVELALRQFFEAPTIADLSIAITQNLAEQADSDLLTQLLAELEQLPEDEVRSVLTTKQSSTGRHHE